MVSDEKRFPLQGGPSVPWEVVAPHEAQAQKNHGQSLRRLAERGGLGCNEFWCLMQDTSLDAIFRGEKHLEENGKRLANEINERYERLNRDLLAARQEIAAANQEIERLQKLALCRFAEARSLEADLTQAKQREREAVEALSKEIRCETCEGTGIMHPDCYACNHDYPNGSCGYCHGTLSGDEECAECSGTKVSTRYPEHAALVASYDKEKAEGKPE